MTLYDPLYRRLRLRHFVNESDQLEELKLPFCSVLDDTNITNSSAITKYQYQSGKYKNSILKRINKKSPVTIKGMVTSDSEVSQHLEGVIQPYDYKTLDYYLYALNNLNPIVIYAFDGSTGTINIESITIESSGKTREFEITGYRSC